MVHHYFIHGRCAWAGQAYMVRMFIHINRRLRRKGDKDRKRETRLKEKDKKGPD